MYINIIVQFGVFKTVTIYRRNYIRRVKKAINFSHQICYEFPDIKFFFDLCFRFLQLTICIIYTVVKLKPISFHQIQPSGKTQNVYKVTQYTKWELKDPLERTVQYSFRCFFISEKKKTDLNLSCRFYCILIAK